MTTQTRRQEIQQLWKDYKGLYVIVGVLIGLLIFPFLEMLITDLSELLMGLVPEAIGIIFTVMILDRAYQQREAQRRIEDLQQRLIHGAGSKIKDIAVKAIEDLRAHDWLKGENSLLKGADLQFANLSRANLLYGNLSRANLAGATLTGANLLGANLRRADLAGANLTEAHLGGANLLGADLRRANLLEAFLFSANLSGANLAGANLDGVIWEEEFEGKTLTATLPDGTKWTPKTKLERFTNPKHPDFWSPED